MILRVGALLSILIVTAVYGETAQDTESDLAAMHRHYDAAYRFQSAGDLTHAIAEHELFLAEALHRLANGKANISEYTQATPLYDEALKYGQPDISIYLDYAGMALDAGDPSKAKRLAQEALRIDLQKISSQQNAKTHLILGRALRALGKYNEALAQYKAAAAINPNYEDVFALGTAYLWVPDTKSAAAIFHRMQIQFGDTANLHMELGRAYGETGYPEQAIDEFKAALAKNDGLPGAHYSLGASYISNSGERAYTEAAAEFRKELRIQPNDYLSYSQLGHIALDRRDFREAEADLKRAAMLDPANPDNYLWLGELYTDTNRPSNAESALRKAIALTTDLSRNHFAVQRAHYRLARLLIEHGAIEEGKKETKISQELLLESRRHDDAILAGKPLVQATIPKKHASTLADVIAVKALEKQLAPLIARSYSNLGVNAGMNKDYADALRYFELSAQWDAAVPELNNNWGRAAFQAQQYAKAVGPLSRSLREHREDNGVRSMLGLSYYMLHSYNKVVQTLQPIETRLDSTPSVEFVYADSMVRTGDFLHGLDRLEVLARANPESEIMQDALGEAYEKHGDYQRAAERLKAAARLNPADTDAKYSLAMSLIKLREKAEAEKLLVELTAEGSTRPEVYYQLGELELEAGDISSAVNSLERAAKMDPQNRDIHHALADAYRRHAQPQDAEREVKLLQALETGRPHIANPAAGTSFR